MRAAGRWELERDPYLLETSVPGIFACGDVRLGPVKRVAAAVGELKAKPGGELQVHGSGNLVRWLVDSHLVDEITLLTYPVVVGQGTRLFPATGPDLALELAESRSTPKGVTIQVYRPTGRPQYETATPDLNT